MIEVLGDILRFQPLERSLASVAEKVFPVLSRAIEESRTEGGAKDYIGEIWARCEGGKRDRQFLTPESVVEFTTSDTSA